ncbi:MAG: hypothetical protein PV353_10230, partial [Bartonella sp.]|nr:hypothetical protein [Bartonella sp.]
PPPPPPPHPPSPPPPPHPHAPPPPTNNARLYLFNFPDIFRDKKFSGFPEAGGKSKVASFDSP